MTRKAKKPARKRTKAAKHKIVAGLEEAIEHARAQRKPSNVAEWEPKRGFWKRVWVTVFGA